ncbi:MAG: hypothetical protein R3C68_07955 [Myxococcota bacterium]
MGYAAGLLGAAPTGTGINVVDFVNIRRITRDERRDPALLLRLAHRSVRTRAVVVLDVFDFVRELQGSDA